MDMSNRLAFLDALRGLAVAVVVIFHVPFMALPQMSAPPAWLVQLAVLSVAFFFMVSGCSLFLTMRNHERTGRPWMSFYIHRAFRILPLYYLVLAIAILVDVPGITDVNARNLTESILLLQNLDPPNIQSIYPVTWTLSVEVLLYLLFPAIYLVARSSTRVITLMAWTSIAWLLVYVVVEAVGLPRRQFELFANCSALGLLPCFLAGVLLFWLLRGVQEGTGDDVARRERGVAWIAVGLVLICCRINGWIPPITGPGWLLAALVCLPLCFGLAVYPVRWLVNRATVYLGTITYSVYLIHPLVIPVVSPVYPAIQRLIPSTTASMFACSFATLAITVAIASVTYRLVERPGITAGRRLTNHLLQPRVTAPEPAEVS